MEMETETDDVIQPSTNMSQREYMRLYKRKQYAEKGEDIRAKNKAYYTKYRYGLSSEDMKKYDTLLPLVNKVRQGLDQLKEKNVNIPKTNGIIIFFFI